MLWMTRTKKFMIILIVLTIIMFVASVINLANSSFGFYLTAPLALLFLIFAIAMYVVQKDVSEYIQSQSMQD
ncbi:MAG: hypothetical protein IJ315_02435 [Firmicutes bacterium]|nr:hypothetical protein [Bacillota bacterium]